MLVFINIVKINTLFLLLKNDCLLFARGHSLIGKTPASKAGVGGSIPSVPVFISVVQLFIFRKAFVS